MSSRSTGKGVGALAVLALGAGLSGCTLVKPIVGVVTGPVAILGEMGSFHTSGDGCAALGLLCAKSAVGAVGGLATGIVSDVQVLTGDADHTPIANWWHPFRINTDSER